MLRFVSGTNSKERYSCTQVSLSTVHHSPAAWHQEDICGLDSSLLHTSQRQFSTYGRWSLATVGMTVRNSLLDPVSNLIVTKTVFSRLLDKFLLACTSTRLSIMGFFYFVLVFFIDNCIWCWMSSLEVAGQWNRDGWRRRRDVDWNWTNYVLREPADDMAFILHCSQVRYNLLHILLPQIFS